MTHCYVWRYFVVYLFICLSACFSGMLAIASSNSLVDELTLISYLNDWLFLDNNKVCEPSTSSNRNSLNNNVCIVFLWYGEIIIIINLRYYSRELQKNLLKLDLEKFLKALFKL